MSQRLKDQFKPDEWEWLCKLAASRTDAEENKAFWDTVREKKRQDSNYSVYTDFPREPLTVAHKVCSEVIEMLKRGIKKEGNSA